MVKTKDHVFIHLQKCAGEHISAFMKKKLGGERIGATHSTILPSEKNKIIVGNIRNPLTYYVSAWAYSCPELKGGLGKTFVRHYPDKKHLFDDGHSVENFQTWLKLMLTDANFGKGNSIDTAAMRRYDIGILTYRFFLLYNALDFSLLKEPDKNVLVDHFIRVESLEEDFDRIFGTNINEERHYKSGKSKHLPCNEYYNESLMDLVYRKDRYIFDKFNYRTEFT